MAEAKAGIQVRQGPRGEELVVPFKRGPAFLLFGVWAVLTPYAFIAAWSELGPWWAGAIAAVLAAIPFAILRGWRRRGLFSGAPLLVLDAQGLQDNYTGVRLEWEEIARIDHHEVADRSATAHYLGVHPLRADAVLQRAGVSRRAAAVAADLFDEPPLKIPLGFAAVPRKDVVAAVERFWGRPIETVEPKFRASARRTAIILAVSIGAASLVAVLIVVARFF